MGWNINAENWWGPEQGFVGGNEVQGVALENGEGENCSKFQIAVGRQKKADDIEQEKWKAFVVAYFFLYRGKQNQTRSVSSTINCMGEEFGKMENPEVA